eukprot:12933949-Alexandrium_andersonii.AAC.1
MAHARAPAEAIGLYGNIQFLFIDPQWARVDAGENFNVSYIVPGLGSSAGADPSAGRTQGSSPP